MARSQSLRFVIERRDTFNQVRSFRHWLAVVVLGSIGCGADDAASVATENDAAPTWSPNGKQIDVTVTKVETYAGQ